VRAGCKSAVTISCLTAWNTQRLRRRARQLAHWYVENLEFVINFEYEGNYFVRAANGTMLEIIPSVGERGSNQMKDPGIRHLAIDVDDFDLAMGACVS
jgi:hypothetical protein